MKLILVGSQKLHQKNLDSFGKNRFYNSISFVRKSPKKCSIQFLWFHQYYLHCDKFSSHSIDLMKCLPVGIGSRWLPKLGGDQSPCPQAQRYTCFGSAAGALYFWCPPQQRKYRAHAIKVKIALATVAGITFQVSKLFEVFIFWIFLISILYLLK